MSKIFLITTGAAFAGNATLRPLFGLATDVDIELPGASGRLALEGPVLCVTGSSQSVTLGVATKVAFDTVVDGADAGGYYNVSSATVGGIPGYAFKPNRAGWYLVSVQVAGNAATTTGRVTARIHKNGVVETLASAPPMGNANTSFVQVGGLIYFDGVDDYIEAFAAIEGTGAATLNGSTNRFSAIYVRP
jgi:hypothetical protein